MFFDKFSDASKTSLSWSLYCSALTNVSGSFFYCLIGWSFFFFGPVNDTLTQPVNRSKLVIKTIIFHLVSFRFVRKRGWILPVSPITNPRSGHRPHLFCFWCDLRYDDASYSTLNQSFYIQPLLILLCIFWVSDWSLDDLVQRWYNSLQTVGWRFQRYQWLGQYRWFPTCPWSPLDG